MLPRLLISYKEKIVMLIYNEYDWMDYKIVM